MPRFAPIQKLGRLSLAIYLVHMPVLEVLEEATFHSDSLASVISSDRAFTAVAVTASVLLAAGVTWVSDKVMGSAQQPPSLNIK